MNRTITTLTIILSLFFLSHQINAQNIIIDENLFIGGDSCFTKIYSSVSTPDGGLVFVGSTQCNNSGDIPATKSYHQDWNVLVGKVDANRNILWVKVYGGTDFDVAVDICNTKDSGYAVLCETKSSNGDVSGHYNNSDLWLLKLNSSGDLLWEKSYGSSYIDEPIAVTEDKEGHLLLFGENNGANIDIPIHYGGTFSFDWVLIKTDASGNKIWAKVYGGTESEGGGSIIITDSNYYIVSGSWSTDINCYDTSWFGTASTASNFHLLKLDTAGNFIWDRSYGGSNLEGVFDALYDDRDNSIVMVGKTTSVDYMLPPESVNSLSWVVKTDLNGDTIWTQILVSNKKRASSMHSICKNNYGGYIIAREVNAVPLGDTTVMSGKSNLNIFVLDSNGHVDNHITYGSLGKSGVDYLGNIIPYQNGYVVSGYSSQNKFDMGRNSGNTNGTVGGGFLTYLYYWPLNIEDANIVSKIEVSPNPAKDRLLIILPPEYEKCMVQIYNSFGKVVYNTKAEKNRIKIDIGSWMSGLYVVRYINKEMKPISRKFLIQK